MYVIGTSISPIKEGKISRYVMNLRIVEIGDVPAIEDYEIDRLLVFCLMVVAR